MGSPVQVGEGEQTKALIIRALSFKRPTQYLTTIQFVTTKVTTAMSDCTWTELKVYPPDWNKKTAELSADWYIWYRFRDPEFEATKPKGYKGFKKIIKGMNREKTLKTRQIATRVLLDDELNKLEHGYNPIHNTIPRARIAANAVGPDTGFIDALRYAEGKKELVPSGKIEMKAVIKYVEMAAQKMHIEYMPVKSINRKKIKELLDRLGDVKGENWTNYNYNYYTRMLSMLFSELEEWEVVEVNPCIGIKRKKHIVEPKVLLTPTERGLINTKLKDMNYEFWRFIQCFFHSGSRLTEFMKLRKEDVNLTRQEITYEVLKGDARRQVRAIKDVALPLWRELYGMAKAGDYIFSVGLIPGVKQIRTDQIKRRWKQWCMEKLGIRATIYSLKHLNSTQVAAEIGTKAAARLNAHNESILKSTYDVEGKDRELEAIKKVGNEL